MEPNKFATIVEAENHLRKRGYDLNLNIDDEGIFAEEEKEKHYQPEEITIDEHHRFEGYSAPEDMAVIYAITFHNERNKKGILIDAYGTYSSQAVGDFLRKVENIKQQGLKK